MTETSAIRAETEPVPPTSNLTEATLVPSAQAKEFALLGSLGRRR